MREILHLHNNVEVGPGEVLVFTSGEYSEYGIKGYCVSLRKFNIRDKAVLFIAEAIRAGNDCPTYDEFISWLCIKELVIPVAHRELFLGGCDRFYASEVDAG